jgi:hypothetical protein
VVTTTEAGPTAASWAAVTATVSAVSSTKVVVEATPPTITVESDAKPTPVTVRVRSPLPATAAGGDRPVMAAPAATGRAAAAEVRPPVATVIAAAPGRAKSRAGTRAVSSLALTTWVASARSPHRTTASASKPLPRTVRVTASPVTAPSSKRGGATAAITGPATTAKLSGAEVPAVTSRVKVAVVAAVRSRAGTTAVAVLPSTKVVARAPPSQRKVAERSKPAPVAVTTRSPPPTVTAAGAIAASVTVATTGKSAGAVRWTAISSGGTNSEVVVAVLLLIGHSVWPHSSMTASEVSSN